MTEQEAIEKLKTLCSETCYRYGDNGCANITSCSTRDCIDMATEALEKQMPKKPIEYEDKYYSCECGNVVMMKWDKYPIELKPKSDGLSYCLCCGQRLDWSETE